MLCLWCYILTSTGTSDRTWYWQAYQQVLVAAIIGHYTQRTALAMNAAFAPCAHMQFVQLHLRTRLWYASYIVPVCCTSYQSVPLPATVYGWPEAYIYTVHDRIFGNFPAKNAVYTPYVGKCFWPTLKRCLFTDVKLNACSPSAA